MKKMALREILFYAAIMFGGTALLVSIDAFEAFYDFSRAHEEYNLDELVLIVPLALVCLAIYSFRRTRDVLRKNRDINDSNRRIKDLVESREQFMSYACHELKSPLVGIISCFQLMEMTRDEAETREYLSMAKEKANILRELIDSVLLYSQLTYVGSEVAMTRLDVRRMMETVLRNTRMDAEQKGLDVSVSVDAGVPEHVVGHEGWIKMVCLNLVGNAIKYTDSGSIAIDCAYTNGSCSELVIQISDTGQGISRDKLEVIFEPYERAGMGMDAPAMGVGLGLSLVKSVVHALKGTISVESEVGVGSRFTVILPVGGN